MRGFAFLDLEKKLFLFYHHSELSYKIEISNAGLVEAIYVSFKGLNISASLHPLTAPKT